MSKMCGRFILDVTKTMRVDEFDFELPSELIALRPASPRDSAQMLVVKPDEPLRQAKVRELPDFLKPGDVLVFNDTKVIPAQLEGTRAPRNGDAPPAKVSATLHMRVDGAQWDAFMRPAKKLRVGDTIAFANGSNELHATIISKGEAGEVRLKFQQSAADLDAALMLVGHIPLPPYIASKREEDAQDRSDYQTVYAREEGAVAAPTAGLHFTDELLDRLRAYGVETQFVTLHVGAGTFLPVKADDTDDHKMHYESGTVSQENADNLNAVHARGGRIVAVGTTSLRLLESATSEDGTIQPFQGATNIFITPGYKFRAVDILMTNFHLPRSTLMMLVSAFAGLQTMRDAYRHAIKNQFRFYSYGDASLLFRKDS